MPLSFFESDPPIRRVRRTPEEKRRRQAAWALANYHRNRERVLTARRASRLVNLEAERAKGRARQAAYYAAHPEVVRAINRRSYAAHRDQRLAQMARYRATPAAQALHALRYQTYYSQPINRMRALFREAVKRAKRDGLLWDLDVLTQLIAELPSTCAACQKALNYAAGRGRGDMARSPSLDRFDNRQGYVLGNVYVICYRCNDLKRNASIEELEHIVAYMRRNGSRH
jgi:hypothetical protein